MIKVLADGENSHRLESVEGRQVGSIRNRAIRLRGLASEAEAIAATCPVWCVLDALLAREFPGWPRHAPAAHRLRLTHDGAYQWISDGRKPLARLIRPAADGTSERTYALEFVLPSYASDGVAISAAQSMALALEECRRSGPQGDGAVVLDVPPDAA